MSTPTDEFPCRTKKVTEVTFRVRIFRDGTLRMSGSCSSRERADNWIQEVKKLSRDYTFTVTEETREETVCVECGQEVNI